MPTVCTQDPVAAAHAHIHTPGTYCQVYIFMTVVPLICTEKEIDLKTVEGSMQADMY